MKSQHDLELVEKWELRRVIGRVLHKTIRQFEVEKCPETFNLKVHIDQILTKAIPIIRQAVERDKNEEINSREIYWRDAVDEAKKAVAEEIEAELKKAWNWESLRSRNQESKTLPIWVRKALGYSIKDKRGKTFEDHLEEMKG